MGQNLFNDDYRVIKNYSWYFQTTDLYILTEEFLDILSENFSNVALERLRVEDAKEKDLNGMFVFMARRDYIINGSPVRMFMCYIYITDKFRNSESETYAIVVKGHGDVISYKEFRINERLEVFRDIVADIKNYEGA